MNIETIELQKTASQQFNVSLGEQTCTIRVIQRESNVYVDLYVDSTAIVFGSIARDRVGLVSHSHLPFKGELLFVDNHGSDDPQYTDFGDRWQLLYLH